MAHIDLESKILGKNDEIAKKNKSLLEEKNVYMINLIASPGAGKTSTIMATINALKDDYTLAVIEGDIAGDVDALAVKEKGVAAVQINTGGSCHLEADMIASALDVIDLDKTDIIIIENVGNLVCPTDFDLGENAKVMILSVPEGDDKPIKYPGVFEISDAIILNKIDTTPVFNFDHDAFEENVYALNRDAKIFPISATKGTGVDAWADWIKSCFKGGSEPKTLSAEYTVHHPKRYLSAYDKNQTSIS